jgi:hypothetical protein
MAESFLEGGDYATVLLFPLTARRAHYFAKFCARLDR